MQTRQCYRKHVVIDGALDTNRIDPPTQIFGASVQFVAEGTKLRPVSQASKWPAVAVAMSCHSPEPCDVDLALTIHPP